MTLPAPVPAINVDTAKQSDVAAWLLQKEAYTRSLENMLKDIATFFNVQQGQLDSTANAQNIQLQQTEAAAQAAEAAEAAKKKVETTVPVPGPHGTTIQCKPGMLCSQPTK